MKKKIFAIVVVGSIALFAVARAFNGPGSNSPPTGSGAINTNAAGNVAIGTSTVFTSSTLIVMGSTTNSTAYTLQIMGANGTPIIYARNDGSVSIATTSMTAGQFTVQGQISASGPILTTVGASNVTAGVFGSGNFAFPSSLGVNTSTQVVPNTLSDYGSLLVTSLSSLASTTVVGNVTTTNLTITGLGSAGSPCLVVSSAGAVSTSTCGSGGSISGIGKLNYIPIWTNTSVLGTSTLQATANALVTTGGFAVGTTTDQPAGNFYLTGNETTTNLTVSGLATGGAPGPCLNVNSTGVVGTTTCTSGGSLSGGQANYFALWSSGSALTTTSLQANGTTTYTLQGLAVGTSTVEPSGSIYVANNYLGGNISASQVSSNVFPSGNYSFPTGGSVGIATGTTVSLPYTLSIYGSTGMTNGLTVGGATTFAGTALHNGAATFASSALFNGTTTFTATSTFASSTIFNGLTTFASTSTFASSTIFNGLTTFTSTSTFSSSTIFTASSTFTGSIAENGTDAATSVSFGNVSLGLGKCSSTIVSMPGVTTGAVVIATPQTYPGLGTRWDSFVTSTGNVQVDICNATGSALTPTASQYNIRIIR